MEDNKLNSNYKNKNRNIKNIKDSVVSDKLPNFHKRIKKRVIRNFIIIILFLIICILFCIYFISPFSRVGQINISGNRNVSNSLIMNSGSIDKKSSVLRILCFKNRIEKNIKCNNPCVKKANIYINKLNHLNILITEYSLIGYKKSGNSYYKILSNGAIINKKINRLEGNVPIFESFPNNYLNLMIKEYMKFPLSIKNSISEIQYKKCSYDPYKIIIFMNSGNEIIGNIKTISDKIIYYPKIAGQLKKKSLIDLEVGAFSYPLSSKS